MSTPRKRRRRARIRVRVDGDQMHQLDIVTVVTRPVPHSEAGHRPDRLQRGCQHRRADAVLRPRDAADRQDRRRREARRSAVRDRQPGGRAGADRPDRRAAWRWKRRSRSSRSPSACSTGRPACWPTRRPRSARSIRRATITPSPNPTSRPRRARLTAARNRLRVIVGRDRRRGRAARARAHRQSADHHQCADRRHGDRAQGRPRPVRAQRRRRAALFDRRSLDRCGSRRTCRRPTSRYVRVGQEIEVQGHRAAGPRVQGAHHARSARPPTRRRGASSCARRSPIPDGALKSEMFATFKIATGDGEPGAGGAGRGRDPRRRCRRPSGSSASRCCSSAAR